MLYLLLGGAESAIAGYVLRLRRASGIHRLNQYHRTPRNDNDNSTTTRAFTCPSSAARATRPPSRYAHIHPSIHPSKHPPPLPTQLTNLPYIQKKVNHGTGLVTYTSPDLQCELTCTVGSDRSCSKMLDGIVKTVGTANGATIVCDPFNKSCEVNEATLAMFLNGGVKVQLRIRYNCARPVLNIPSIRLSSVQSTPRHTYTTHANPPPKQ